MTAPARPLQGEADAAHVIANPALYAHRPTLRLAAWLVLTSRRGRPTVQSRRARQPTETAND